MVQLGQNLIKLDEIGLHWLKLVLVGSSSRSWTKSFLVLFISVICISGDVGLADRFEEYPKLRELIRLKNKLVDEVAQPPMYLKCDLETFDFKSLDHKFDVILIEPPLEEYARSYGVNNVKFWDWDKIMALDISEVAAQRWF